MVENNKSKDLSGLLKAFEKLLKTHFRTKERVGLVVSFLDPHTGHTKVHWMSNLSPQDGVTVIESTTKAMREKFHGQS